MRSNTLTQFDSVLIGQFHSSSHDLGCQFRIRREGNVLLLHCCINNDLLFLGLLAMQIKRGGQNPLCSVFADAFAKMCQIAQIAWQSPAYLPLSAEILRVGAFAPKLHHLFVAEIHHTLKHEKSHHASDRQGRTPFHAVKRTKDLFKTFPVDGLC